MKKKNICGADVTCFGWFTVCLWKWCSNTGRKYRKESSGSFASEEQAVAGGTMKKKSTQEQSSKGSP